MRFFIVAKGLYPNGTEGDVIAEVEGDSLQQALERLSFDLRYHLGSEWQLGDGEDDELTDALDVTVSWKGVN